MSNPSPADATVLLVDDDEVAARDLRDLLTGFGHCVHVAESAQAAMAVFESDDVDLILLNLTLPDADGLMLCSSLSSRSSTPIIMLSARPRAVDRLLSLALGASDFLSKPVELDALERIQAALADKQDREFVAASR